MSVATTTEAATADLGLGTAYERVAIYDLFDRWTRPLGVATAAEGPIDGMAGIPGLHLLGLARRGVRVTVALPDAASLARVRAIYRMNHADARLETRVLAPTELPRGPFDLIVSYNAIPLVDDWRAYLARLFEVEARYAIVVVSNPRSYGVALRKVQRAIRRERARGELFDHEATHREVIEPALARHGRVLEHAYLDCPWWPDFLLPARQNLAGAVLARVRGALGRRDGGDGDGDGAQFVFGEGRYPFFEDQEGYAEMQRALRAHPVFDARGEPLARIFGHLHGYLVERR